MSRRRAALTTVLFLVLAPGTVAGAIPFLISGWPSPAAAPLSVLGTVLVILGIVLTLECFVRFVRQGGGTPAPLAPTERLVVSGPYRWVRNPMYVGMVSVILGQAALFSSLQLLVYGLAVWLILSLIVLVYEEPTLRRTFPLEYAAYFGAVPRWRPRLRPWRPS